MYDVLIYLCSVFICSQRTGQIRVLSFKVGLVLLCKGHLEEKYRCELMADFLHSVFKNFKHFASV